MEIESIFAMIGYWGRYQKRLAALLVLSVIPNGMQILVMVFTHETPSHRCFIPQLDNETFVVQSENGSVASLANYIPLEHKNNEMVWSQCRMFLAKNSVTSGNSTKVNEQELNRTTRCLHGWVYELPPGKETVISEWDLVCENAWMKPLASSSFILGIVFGSIIAGYLSDRYGRLLVFLIGNYLQFFFAFLSAISVNLVMYSVMLIMCGAVVFANFSAALILVSEVLDPERRGIFGSLELVSFAVGTMVTSLLAYVFLSWRNLLFALSAPVVFFIPYSWFVDESPRWLIQRGRTEDANKVLVKIAKVNGTWNSGIEEILSDDKYLLDAHDKENSQNSTAAAQQCTYFDLIRHPVICRRILISCYSWIVLNVAYFFLLYNIGNLGGNLSINCILAASVEILAAFCMMFLVNKVGRCTSYIGLMCVAAVTCISIPFLLEVNGIVGIVVAMIGMFSVDASFDIFFLYTPEMFPTLLRYKAFGISSSLGRIGAVSAPYFVYWGENINKNLPYIIVCILISLNAFIALGLPETRNVPVPNTISDAENMKSKFSQCCGNNLQTAKSAQRT